MSSTVGGEDENVSILSLTPSDSVSQTHSRKDKQSNPAGNDSRSYGPQSESSQSYGLGILPTSSRKAAVGPEQDAAGDENTEQEIRRRILLRATKVLQQELDVGNMTREQMVRFKENLEEDLQEGVEHGRDNTDRRGEYDSPQVDSVQGRGSKTSSLNDTTRKCDGRKRPQSASYTGRSAPSFSFDGSHERIKPKQVSAQRRGTSISASPHDAPQRYTTQRSTYSTTPATSRQSTKSRRPRRPVYVDGHKAWSAASSTGRSRSSTSSYGSRGSSKPSLIERLCRKIKSIFSRNSRDDARSSRSSSINRFRSRSPEARHQGKSSRRRVHRDPDHIAQSQSRERYAAPRTRRQSSRHVTSAPYQSNVTRGADVEKSSEEDDRHDQTSDSSAKYEQGSEIRPQLPGPVPSARLDASRAPPHQYHNFDTTSASRTSRSLATSAVKTPTDDSRSSEVSAARVSRRSESPSRSTWSSTTPASNMDQSSLWSDNSSFTSLSTSIISSRASSEVGTVGLRSLCDDDVHGGRRNRDDGHSSRSRHQHCESDDDGEET